MITKLFEIAGERKKDLIRGTVLKVIESFFAGSPLFILYLTLNELFSASIDIRKLIFMVIGMAACLYRRFWEKRQKARGWKVASKPFPRHL